MIPASWRPVSLGDLFVLDEVEEAPRSLLSRIVEHRAGSALFANLAIIREYDTVGDLAVGLHFVRYNDHGHPASLSYFFETPSFSPVGEKAAGKSMLASGF
jgi:hypothetical protein